MARDSLLWGLSRSYHLVFSICRGDSMTPLNLRRREGGVILVVPEIRCRIYSNKGGFPLSQNFYVRTDVNFNWLYVRK